VVLVRGYILTERERKILQAYVKEGVKLDGFSVLSLRLKRASATILADVELVNETLRKFKTEDR